jgi:hypothetical protein
VFYDFEICGEAMCKSQLFKRSHTVCRDPNLWLVRCRIGEEKQTAMQVMRKFIAYQLTEEVRLWVDFIVTVMCIFSRLPSLIESVQFEGEMFRIWLY